VPVSDVAPPDDEPPELTHAVVIATQDAMLITTSTVI
jgi:hypothetical protein